MVKIIAEVGSNHNGSLDTAKELIKQAAWAGAHIVKFQSFLVDAMVPKTAPYYKQMKQLELQKDWYEVLVKECNKHGVQFLSTATNFTTIEWMEALDVSMYKVASGNITHRPIIDKLIAINKPIILSLGLISIDELYELVAYFKTKEFTKYSFMHCVSQYPTQPSNARLGNIALLKQMFDCEIGYSDHTLSISAPSIALTQGATIIEKHISLDKTGIGMDHEVAISPDEFKQMVEMIKQTKQMLSVDLSCDQKGCYEMRRSLHLAKSLPAGHCLQEGDLKISRPQNGLDPKYYKTVLGRCLKRDMSDEEPLLMEDIDD